MYLKIWTDFAIVETKACWQPLLIILDHEDGKNPMILLAFGHKPYILKMWWNFKVQVITLFVFITECMIISRLYRKEETSDNKKNLILLIGDLSLRVNIPTRKANVLHWYTKMHSGDFTIGLEGPQLVL